MKGALLLAILLPLSDRDTTTGEYGCETSFVSGKATYVYAINTTLLVRTAKGITKCGVDGSIIDAGFEGERTLTCGDVRMSIKPTGKRTGSAEADSVSGPTTLTVTSGAKRQVLRGTSGTAC